MYHQNTEGREPEKFFEKYDFVRSFRVFVVKIAASRLV